MSARSRTLMACAAAVTLIAASAAIAPPPLVVWNATISAPKGFYWINPPRHLRSGDLVLAPQPANATWLAERRYLAPGVPLIKPIAAQQGDHVCAIDGGVFINGALAAETQARDHAGRTLPVWSECRALGPNEIFLVSHRPDSLDSRYFGPVQRDAVIGRAVPLWTEGAR